MSSQNDLIQGLDLAGETQVSGADLEQLVREAKPNSHIAFNLFGTDSPDVTSNSRYARYIRYTAAGAWPQYYDSGTLTWTNIPLASGAVTTSKIADGSVTLEKFDTTTGTALQYLRINAGATGAEWADFTLTDATVTPAKLTAGAASQLLVTNTAGTQAEWKSAGTWFTDLASKVVNLSNLTQSSATTYDVPAWNGTAWAAAGVETLIPANSVPLSALAIGSGAAYQLVRVNAGGTAFETGTLSAASVTPGTANQVFQTNSAGSAASWQTLFTTTPATVMSTTVTTYAAGLTYTPKFIRCYASPTTVQNGYATTDQVDISMFSAGEVSSANYNAGFFFEASTGSFKAIFKETDAASTLVHNKSTQNNEAVTAANWNVYFVYSNF